MTVIEDRVSEEGRKRGLFAPVVLILLTFSLIGNVFLYADRLHGRQSAKQEEGLAIIRQQIGARTFFEEAGTGITGLIRASNDIERMDAKYRLGLALGSSGDAVALIGKAAALTGGHAAAASQDAAAKAAADALNGVKQSLAGVASHAGPLTEGERKYLESLNGMFARMAESAGRLETGFLTKEAAMQARAGGAWTTAANEWAKLLGQASAIHPSS